MTLDTFIAAGASLAAMVSALYAYRSADIAKKALKLDTADFRAKKPNRHRLNIYRDFANYGTGA